MANVIVVGAGYAGLFCAYRLQQGGHQVTLLEARERVGGRTFDAPLPGDRRLELGGQYIAPVQTRVCKLVAELGLETYTAYGDGDRFILLGDRVARFQGAPAAALVEQLGQPPIVQEEIDATLALLGDLLKQVPAATPWTAPLAAAWDAMTFQSWLNEALTTDLAKTFFRLMVNQGFSTEPEQISLLQMLWFLQTSHGVPPWASGGSQPLRVEGGTQGVAIRLAEKLGKALVMGQPVTAVQQDEQGVVVTTPSKSYRADAVVICVPPQLIGHMTYEPRLPSDLHRAFAAFQTGNAMKVQAVYETPFWREAGWAGTGISFSGPQMFTYDNSIPDGPGVLLGFVTATNATKWNDVPLEERKAAVLATWAKVLGSKALQPIEYIEQDWAAEDFTRGGHGCHFPPGVWAELGPALGGKEPPQFGRILWAASDLAKDWNGYLEGALMAGEAAAAKATAMFA
ncbi:MAG: flavin monoamine oxidase family protein [Chlamydiia bacterium]